MRGLRFEITANSLVDLLSLLIAAKVRTRAIGSLSLPALPHEKFYGQELEMAALECESVAAELLVRPLAARNRLLDVLAAENIVSLDSVKASFDQRLQGLQNIDKSIRLDAAFVLHCVSHAGDELAFAELLKIMPAAGDKKQTTLEISIAGAQALQQKPLHKYLPACSQRLVGKALELLQRIKRVQPLDAFTFAGHHLKDFADRLPFFIYAVTNDKTHLKGLDALKYLLAELLDKAEGAGVVSLSDIDHVRKWTHLLHGTERTQLQELREKTLANTARLQAAALGKHKSKKRKANVSVVGASSSTTDVVVGLASMFD